MNGGETLTLAQAADAVQIDANELKHFAQRGEIDASVRGGEWFISRHALDEWAQRHLLSSSAKSIARRHRAFSEKRRRESRPDIGVGDLLNPASVCLSIAAKAKGGIIRDMTDLAEASGLVYDGEALFRELVAREEAASTAIGPGAAFLHPRTRDPYLFEESFIAYGRSVRPIFFGAPDGAGTRHFFLVCCTGPETHLHALARLAMLAHGSGLMALLDAAETPDDVVAALRECEAEYSR